MPQAANPLIKIKAPKAGEVITPVLAELKGFQGVDDDLAPLALLDRLLAEPGTYVEAFAFLAHALPQREAVWWGCLATRLVQGPRPPLEEQALGAAALWVLNPLEAHGRLAEAAAAETPASAAVTAVCRAVSAEPWLAAAHISAVLVNLMFEANSQEVTQRLLALGVGLALGKYEGPPAPKAAAPAPARGRQPSPAAH
jgi:hypothetical protein